MLCITSDFTEQQSKYESTVDHFGNEKAITCNTSCVCISKLTIDLQFQNAKIHKWHVTGKKQIQIPG